ncbi:hypothetical protein BRD05_07700 [Halobacteriales archaeon QS_9_70_65]|nr:MAG: hypothetical protein BRD05_07700 [Halobacteriales archaeon QS_9_70_65]
MSDGHPRTDEEPADATASGDDARSEVADREFDYRGWTLVVALFVSIVVIPGIIYLYPRVGPSFGLTFYDTYLALPMIPAVVLGILAVWATTRP